MAPTHSRQSWRLASLLLLVLILAAGVAYSFTLPGHARFPDEEEYLLLSTHILHGPGFSMDGTHLTAMRPPGYPVFLAAIQALGGNMEAVRVVQYLIFGLTLFLVAQLLPGTNFYANLLVVTGVTLLYPVLFYTTATLYPQTLSAMLFVLALGLLFRERRGLGINLTIGLVFGALLLVVPTFALTMIVVLAVAWWLKILRWHECLPILAGAAVIVSVWTVRNEIVFHRLIPFASNSGENLLIGNSENTVAYGGSGNVDRTHYSQEAQAQGLDEFETDKYYQHAAVTWITQHPGRAFVLYLEKTANYFNVYNQYAPGTNAEVSPWKQIIMGLSYVLLLALLAWRLVEWKRFPLDSREKLLLLVYVLSAFSMAIFVTRIRYRLPYDYLVIAVVAGHLVRRLELWLAARKST